MRNWLKGWLIVGCGVAALTAAFLAPVEGQAQQAKAPVKANAFKAPRTKDGKPNLNGIWMSNGMANWDLEPHGPGPSTDPKLGSIYAVPPSVGFVVGGKIPYKPEALKKKQENFAARAKEDPEAKCYMLGVPRSMYFPMPFQIFQGNGDYFISQPFAATNRLINMNDTSGLPVESWMGKSNGKWEGSTLVVTTLDQNEKTWLDRAGNFHSDDLKVTERFTLIDKDHIRYEATMEDPNVYSRPWTIEMPLYRVIEDNAQVMEHKCVPFADKLLYSDLLHLQPPPKNPGAKK